MATRLTSVDELRDFLRIPSSETGQDARLATVIEDASSECEEFTGRAFTKQGYSNEASRGGGSVVTLKNYPVDSGATFQVKSFDGIQWTIFDQADYAVDYDLGIVRLIGLSFAALPNGAQVSYTGGYVSTGAGTAQKIAVTGDLSRSVRSLAAAMYKNQAGVINQDELSKVRTAAEEVWARHMRVF